MESLELAQLREILVVVLLGLLSLVIAVLLDAGLLMRESFRKEQELFELRQLLEGLDLIDLVQGRQRTLKE